MKKEQKEEPKKMFQQIKQFFRTCMVDFTLFWERRKFWEFEEVCKF